MELTIYDIVKGPVVSDKAYKLNKKLNRLVLKVHIDANKTVIKQAIEKLFNVKVEKVATSIRKFTTARSASRRYNARPSIRKEKIAYISLAEGHALNLFEQAGVPAEGTNK
jgi:large subunit ribosomal protein L23